MPLSDSLLKAAIHAGKTVFSKPYTNTKGSFFRANFYYQCSDGHIIHRPNHSILVPLRSMTYLESVIEYYKINGTDEVKKLLESIDVHEIQKIQYLLLFYTSGRENEVNYQDDPELYNQFRKNAEKSLINYFSEQESQLPFNDKNEMESYAKLLQCFALDNLDPKSKAIVLLLRSCHSLNLLRCSSHNNFQKNIDETFNNYSKYKNTRNLQSLVYYAQNCTIATGDKLRTEYKVQNIIGVHTQQGFTQQLTPSRLKPIKTGNNSIVLGARGYDDALFTESCKTDCEGIQKTIERLDNVKKPYFYQHHNTDNQYNTERAKQVISDGNGAVRIINGTSFRLEAEKLTNPKYVRPIQIEKFNIDHSNYYDLTLKKYIKREEKAYIDVSKQSHIDSPKAVNEYKNDKKISKQADRGKPKNTIFTKKQSFSLLPKNGKLSHFSGRFQDRIAQEYISVGTLYNLEELERKGERFVWPTDVRSGGYKGFFWLTRGNKNTKISSLIPSLDFNRYDRKCSIAELKETVTMQDTHSEMLLCASLKALEAIFAVTDTRRHRLAALFTRSALAIDYGCNRPLLIIDKQASPKAYDANQIKRDLCEAINKYKRWYWRLFHFFIKATQEYTLLLNLIKLVSEKSMSVNVEELTERILAIGSPNSGKNDSQKKIMTTLNISQFSPSDSLDNDNKNKPEVLSSGASPAVIETITQAPPRCV